MTLRQELFEQRVGKTWRIASVRAGGSLWWVVFFRGQKHARLTSLAAAMDHIGRHYKPH